MTLDVAREVPGWCTVINYALVFLWFIIFAFTGEWMYRLHGHWFPLSVEQFAMVHYAGMALYKVGILLLNLVPYVALHLVG